MLTSQRKQHLLSLLRRDGQIVAKALSQELGLSEDTIRRDLRELAAEGLVQRVHGGALPASPAAVNFTARQDLASEAKVAVGRAAARLVQPDQIVILDGGTTAVQVARHLPLDLKATVVTHSPTIAVELAQHPGVEVVLIGGRLFKHSVVAVGAAAIEAIGHVRADTYFMGVTGVHVQEGLSTGDLEEAHVKRALSRRAAETVVLASSEKLGVASPYVIASISEVSGLVVEQDVPEDVTTPYIELGLSIIRA
ncbi:DeoR/GlpR family DNA-binding transcription regulator [Deinococcus hopiensis]|uniref:Transcriptional regulator, DeoR family n=1 Tax=Deinococcus hopiensis KR-140 TaxID=695939 RepID=A0A1W1VVX6_9DEIO|nr:DeoR/GlpR family DNA-binding transcription regulator [Deinococcus hopiensis]SMB97024.1 transcriptional regulator, DeoR family [Deinococcus hopiensis KR-140]